MRSHVLLYLLPFLVAGSILLSFEVRVAPAQQFELIAAGELEYQRSCATCHGIDGRGGGVMSKFLTIEPSDLTLLTKKNAGQFPFWQTYRVIDGRAEVRAHGTREMPVWGSLFQAEAGGGGPDSRAQASGRILSLVFYLQHLQQEIEE